MIDLNKEPRWSHEELVELSDSELMQLAADWIEACAIDHMDGGGPMPSEILGKRISTVLAERADFLSRE